jgi:hypothetical protein
MIFFGIVCDMAKRKQLVDEYRFSGFRPLATVKVHPDDPDARIITLQRRQKKRCAAAAEPHITYFTIGGHGLSATFPVETLGFILQSRYAVCDAGSAEK